MMRTSQSTNDAITFRGANPACRATAGHTDADQREGK